LSSPTVTPTLQRFARREAPVERRPHALLGGQDQRPGRGVEGAWGRMAAARPGVGLVPFGPWPPEPPGGQCGVAPGALEAPEAAVVQSVGLRAPSMRHDAGVCQGAASEPSGPIGVGARAAGGRQGEARADLPQADGGHEPVEVVPPLGGGAALAEVLLQEHDVPALPAQLHGPVGQGVLPRGTVALAVHLAWGRLAAVDIGLAVQRVGTAVGPPRAPPLWGAPALLAGEPPERPGSSSAAVVGGWSAGLRRRMRPSSGAVSRLRRSLRPTGSGARAAGGPRWCDRGRLLLGA
jgi:hypothetical protein